MFDLEDEVFIDQDEMEEYGVFLDVDYDKKYSICKVTGEDFELKYYELINPTTNKKVMMNENVPYSFIDAELREVK